MKKEKETILKNSHAKDDIASIVNVTKMKHSVKSIEDILFSKKDSLMKIAAESLSESNMDKYLSNIAFHVANNPLLAKCFDSNEGILSILSSIREAARTGILPGTDAYIIAYKQKIPIEGGKPWEGREVHIARLEPTCEGLEVICLSHPNPMFSQVITGLVYESDHLEIEKSLGVINHKSNPTKQVLGDLIGVWIKATPVDSNNIPIVEYWSLSRIEKTRDEHSPSWKSYVENNKLYQDCDSGKIKNAKIKKDGGYEIPNYYGQRSRYNKNPAKNDNVWNSDLEKMCVKTVKKSFLRPFAKIKAGLLRSQVINTCEKSVDSKPGIANKASQVLKNKINNLQHEENE